MILKQVVIFFFFLSSFNELHCVDRYSKNKMIRLNSIKIDAWSHTLVYWID